MRFPWEPTTAVLGVVVLVASLAWLETASDGVVQVSTGRAASADPALAALRMPDIGDLDRFDVNDDNPFVPYHERVGRRTPAAGTGGMLPPHPEPEVPTQPIPPRDLPSARTGGGDAPRVLGFIRAGERVDGLQVRLPGESDARTLHPGERVGRWTLRAIDSGNIAVFADETGRRYDQVIGGR